MVAGQAGRGGQGRRDRRQGGRSCCVVKMICSHAADDLNGRNASIVYCLSTSCELDVLADAAIVTHCRREWHSANSIAILPSYMNIFWQIYMQQALRQLYRWRFDMRTPWRRIALSVLDSYLPAIRSMCSPIPQAAWTGHTHICYYQTTRTWLLYVRSG